MLNVIEISAYEQWARGKPMAWDVTVPVTYAESHVGSTATKPGAEAQKTAQT